MLFLFACGSNEPAKKEDRTPAPGYDSAIEIPGDEELPELDPDEEGYVPEKEVVFNEEIKTFDQLPSPKESRVKDPFRVIDALALIFPGKDYRFQWNDENIDMMVWRCSSCDSVALADELAKEEGDVYFPGTSVWDTRALKTLSYTFNNRDYLVLPFYSAAYEYEAVHTGRFNAPVVGISLFTKEDSGWKMLGVNRNLAAMGSFGTADQLTMLHSGESVVLSQKSSNGGAGGPFLGARLIYVWENSKWTVGLRIPASSCIEDGIFEWGTEVSVLEERSEKVPGLQSVMKGNVSEEYGYDWLMESLPAEVKKAAAGKVKYSFIYTVKWEWKKGKYVAKSSQVTINNFILPEQ